MIDASTLIAAREQLHGSSYVDPAVMLRDAGIEPAPAIREAADLVDTLQAHEPSVPSRVGLAFLIGLAVGARAARGEA